MEIHTSVCPYDCPDACGLLVGIVNGRVVKVGGNPAHGFTRGTLCPKMAHYERTVYSPRRLLMPMLRAGARGEGQFIPISWDEAIERIATRWKRIIAESGAEAILPYSYAGTMGLLQHDALFGFFHALGASELDRTICSPAKAHGWKSVMGGTLAVPPQEAGSSDCIILWGISTLATNLHFMHDVTAARRKGAGIWLIDTYSTATAKIADHVVLVRPGTDGALALGLMHIIARDRLADEAFLREHVLGWEVLRDTVLPKYPPEAVSSVTGVPEGTLEELAHAYAGARAPFIRLGSGLSRYTNGAMTCRLITCLPAVVGAWARKGGGLLSSVPGSSAFDREIIRHRDFCPTPRRTINMCRIGDALLEADPPIRSLFVYASNPACTAPDQNRVLAGLSREDLFTVVQERFLTDTARYADIVLPVTSSLEHNDVYAAYGHYTLGIGRALIEPVGLSKSNWEVARLLAAAMGLEQPFFRKSEEDLVQELIASTRKWPLPVDTERLAAGAPVELPLPEGYKMDFRTPSGKIEIVNEREPQAVPDYFPAAGDNADFAFVSAPDLRVLDSSFNERDDLAAGNVMTLLMNRADAERLSLVDGETVTVWNERGSAGFTLKISDRTVSGVVVCEGLWWLERTGGKRSINALTSQRLTDRAGGSTFYDVRVNVRAGAPESRTPEK